MAVVQRHKNTWNLLPILLILYRNNSQLASQAGQPGQKLAPFECIFANNSNQVQLQVPNDTASTDSSH